MRSFIKSHKRSQSAGSSEAHQEDLNNENNTSSSNSSRRAAPSLQVKTDLWQQSPGHNSSIVITSTSPASPHPTTPVLSSGFRSLKDSRPSPISSAPSPRMTSGSVPYGQNSTMFSSPSSTILLPTNSSSSLKKLNPITFIRRRRASDGHPEFHIPSAEEYKEAGSIFGTRTHDWGSTPSTSPVFQPTPVYTPPAASSYYNSTTPSNGTTNVTSYQTSPSSPISPLGVTSLPLPVCGDFSLNPALLMQLQGKEATDGSHNLHPSIASKLTSSDLSLVKEEDELEEQSLQSGFQYGLGVFSGDGTSLEPKLSQDQEKVENSIYNENTDLGLIDLKKELSSIIRSSRILEPEDVPPLPDLETMISQGEVSDVPSTPALSIEKRSSDTTPDALSGSSSNSIVADPEISIDENEEDGDHSEFSFEEEVRMGRSTSINYHKPSVSYTDEGNPRYKLDDISSQSVNYLYSSDEDEFDDYVDNCDFSDLPLEDDAHLFGTTSLDDSQDSPRPIWNPSLDSTNHLYKNISVTQVAPLRISTQFSDDSEVELKSIKDEDLENEVPYSPSNGNDTSQTWDDSYDFSTRIDDSFDADIDDDCYDDDFNYDSLLDEVNAVPTDLEVDYDDIFLYRSGSANGKSKFGLRKAKTYSYEGQYASPYSFRRQSGVIKTSDSATVTLFSDSPSLSKKSSTSSSGSTGDTLSSSTSSVSSEHLTSAEVAELTYGSFLKDLPMPSIPRRASLTPISERSYESDYSTCKHDTYDYI